MDDINQQEFIALITQAVIKELEREASQFFTAPSALAGDPMEVVIGLGPAYGDGIRRTINGLDHNAVLGEIKAGIEEEGMKYRVVKVFTTSDVAFIGKAAADISGSGIGIGLQSKGTAVIHHKDLYPLSNLELFAQAPSLSLDKYRRMGQNAAQYAKGESVKPVEVTNNPMVRAAYQVKAALMHIKETEKIDPARGMEEVKGALE